MSQHDHNQLQHTKQKNFKKQDVFKKKGKKRVKQARLSQ